MKSLRVRVTTQRKPVAQSPQLLAVGFVEDAIRYLELAARAEGVREMNPQYFLFGHAFELLLKAVALSTGRGASKVRSELGHDLLRAQKWAVQAGFSPSEAVKAAIESMAPYHSDFSFRYKKPGFRLLPAPNYMEAVIREMIGEIEPMVRSRYRATRLVTP